VPTPTSFTFTAAAGLGAATGGIAAVTSITAPLAFNISTANLQSALNALPNLPPGGSFGVTQNGRYFRISFLGTLAGVNQLPLVADGAQLVEVLSGAHTGVVTLAEGGGLNEFFSGGINTPLPGGIVTVGNGQALGDDAINEVQTLALGGAGT